MRRKDREITGDQALADILKAGTVCSLALQGDVYPYVVPLNYGFALEDGGFILYFHCAGEGEKLERMRANPHVAFSIVSHAEVYGDLDDACSYSTAYQSILGRGMLSIVQGIEKYTGMQAIMRQAAPGQDFAMAESLLEHVTILRLDVHEITGKHSRKRT